MSDIVAYYRVSTKRQGESGLGLEGQQAAVEAHAQRTGAKIIASYREVESGKLADRPELAKGLCHARRAKATLVVAQLDRLARNVAFLSTLLRSGVDFCCCDNAHANKLTIHILAAVAEDEAERISSRVKAALKAAKARGTLLGSARPGHWEGREEARRLGADKGRLSSSRTISRRAREAYADLQPLLQDMRTRGMTLKAMAGELNIQGHTTRRGKSWNPMQVARVLERSA